MILIPKKSRFGFIVLVFDSICIVTYTALPFTSYLACKAVTVSEMQKTSLTCSISMFTVRSSSPYFDILCPSVPERATVPRSSFASFSSVWTPSAIPQESSSCSTFTPLAPVNMSGSCASTKNGSCRGTFHSSQIGKTIQKNFLHYGTRY